MHRIHHDQTVPESMIRLFNIQPYKIESAFNESESEGRRECDASKFTAACFVHIYRMKRNKIK